MAFEPEEDEQKVAVYVGLPDGRRFDMARFPMAADQLAGGQGYVLVHWGVRVEWDLAQDSDPPWPYATAVGSISSVEWVPADEGTLVPRPIVDGPVTIQLWLIQAYRPGCPLAAERRWHPDLGVRDSIVGLEVHHRQADLLDAWHGQALIAARQEVDTRSLEEIRRTLHLQRAAGAARQLFSAGTKPTAPLIRDLLDEDEPGLELETLKQRWQRCKPPIRMAEILRIASQP